MWSHLRISGIRYTTKCMSKILLVEDDVIESRMYQNLFAKENFELVAVDNGQDCRAKAIEMKPDIILLDVMMPKMNGFETLDVLQFDAETKGIPVIMLTNLSDKHYEDEALRRGAVKYIIKSQIENSKLLRIIRDIISAYESKSQPRV
jgi:PleD family two-component response regulator